MALHVRRQTCPWVGWQSVSFSKDFIYENKNIVSDEQEKNNCN